MAIVLKLVPKKGEDDLSLQTLEFIQNNSVVSVEAANKEGFTIDSQTFKRVRQLVELGLKYEVIEKSHKSEFKDLDLL